MINALNMTGLNNNYGKTEQPVTPDTVKYSTLGTMFSDKYASILYWMPRLI